MFGIDVGEIDLRRRLRVHDFDHFVYFLVHIKNEIIGVI